MKYIIIGLGDYGFALADELATVGHEVIGVDNKPAHVEPLKDKLAAAFVMDATDEQALAALPLRNVDAVIVAIGENFGVSVRVTALLYRDFPFRQGACCSQVQYSRQVGRLFGATASPCRGVWTQAHSYYPRQGAEEYFGHQLHRTQCVGRYT